MCLYQLSMEASSGIEAVAHPAHAVIEVAPDVQCRHAVGVDLVVIRNDEIDMVAVAFQSARSPATDGCQGGLPVMQRTRVAASHLGDLRHGAQTHAAVRLIVRGPSPPALPGEQPLPTHAISTVHEIGVAPIRLDPEFVDGSRHLLLYETIFTNLLCDLAPTRWAVAAVKRIGPRISAVRY